LSWFKKIFGDDEEAQAATAALPAKKKPPAPSPSFAGDFAGDDVIPRSAGEKKVTLNFKKIPRKIVEAIAAETTGQPRTIVLQTDSGDGSDDLARAFNDAASPAPKMVKPKMMAPKP